MSKERHPLQRCRNFTAGLLSQPWWKSSQVPIVEKFENKFERIREEFNNILLCGRLKLHPQSKDGPERSIADGDWNIFELCSHGVINERNAIEAPFTSQLIAEIPDISSHPSGLAYFSVLQPRVHISAHCGPTNARIRVHLGIRIPVGAIMRVGTETKTWTEGRCLVFDDSWEHEVFNRSDFFRAVLLFDIWHPDLSPDQRTELGSVGQTGGKDAGNAVHLRREGWMREGNHTACPLSDSDLASQYFNILNTLDKDCLVSIVTTAEKACGCSDLFIAHSTRFVLQAQNGLGALTEVAAQRGKESIFGAKIWRSLADLVEAGRNYRYAVTDVINMIHICSLYWRSDVGNVGVMGTYVNNWSAVDKGTMLRSLVKLSSPAELLRYLADSEAVDDSAPFGAVAPVAVAALQQQLARSRE